MQCTNPVIFTEDLFLQWYEEAQTVFGWSGCAAAWGERRGQQVNALLEMKHLTWSSCRLKYTQTPRRKTHGGLQPRTSPGGSCGNHTPRTHLMCTQGARTIALTCQKSRTACRNNSDTQAVGYLPSEAAQLPPAPPHSCLLPAHMPARLMYVSLHAGILCFNITDAKLHQDLSKKPVKWA